MPYEQRASRTKDRTEGKGFWRPDELADILPRAADAYLVVDDLIAGTLRLVAAPWPALDRGGRLLFSASGRRRSQPVEVFSAEEVAFRDAVNAARTEHRQINRDIRIGDAFWVRGLASRRRAKPHPSVLAPPPAVPSWLDLVDVTTGARLAAKTALYAAVAPRVTPDQADALSLVGDEDEPPPPPPTSGPIAPASV